MRARHTPELRSPCTIPCECRNSIPSAISLMVAATTGRLGPPEFWGPALNHPQVTASCVGKTLVWAQQTFLRPERFRLGKLAVAERQRFNAQLWLATLESVSQGCCPLLGLIIRWLTVACRATYHERALIAVLQQEPGLLHRCRAALLCCGAICSLLRLLGNLPGQLGDGLPVC